MFQFPAANVKEKTKNNGPGGDGRSLCGQCAGVF